MSSHLITTTAVLYLTLLLYPLLVNSLSLLLPLTTQYPPVAQPGVPYAFSFAHDTFGAWNGSNASFNYTADGLPDWATFDALALSLSGTPPLDASDSSWNVTISALTPTSTTASSFPLYLSSSPAPSLALPIPSQLSTAPISGATVLPSSSGILVPPSAPFSLSLSPSTFTLPPSPQTNWSFPLIQSPSPYPLPAWLIWDPTTLTLSGTTPSYALSLPLLLLAVSSAYPNARQAQVPLMLEVGTNALELIEVMGGVNTTVRDHVRWFFWPEGVQLNGVAVDPSEVEVDWDLSAVPWLSYDNQTRFLTGTTPDSLLNGTSTPLAIPMSLSLPSTPSAPAIPTSIPLLIHPYKFTSISLPPVNVSLDQFNYSFLPFLRAPVSPNTYFQVFLDPVEASSWLALSTDGTSLTGLLPPNTSYDHINIELLAWDEPTNLTSTCTLLLALPSYHFPSNSSSGGPYTGQSDTSTGSGGLSTSAKVVLAAVLGSLLLIALLALLLFCCCRRRRRRTDDDSSIREKGIGKPQRAISTFGPTVAVSRDLKVPELASASTSPTLRGSTPDGKALGYGYGYGYGGAHLDPHHSVPTDEHVRSQTPVDQLRTMYPSAFLTSPSTSPSPPTLSLLASDSQDTCTRAPPTALSLPADALRRQFGVTASGSEQVRMIDAAVRYSSASEGEDRGREGMDGLGAGARRSKFMSMFGPDGLFGGVVGLAPHHHSDDLDVSRSNPEVFWDGDGQAAQEALGEGEDVWAGRQYDAFGRLVKRPTEPDIWGAGSEPRALGQSVGFSDVDGDGDGEMSNPFGTGLSASTLGLDHSLAYTHTDPGLGYSDEDEEDEFRDGDGDEDEDEDGSFEASEVRKARVVDVSDSVWRATGTGTGAGRIVHSGADWTAEEEDSILFHPGQDIADAGLGDSLKDLGYPVSTLFSPSMSIRLIDAAGTEALSPDSVSTARLGQNTSPVPSSTPRAVTYDHLLQGREYALSVGENGTVPLPYSSTTPYHRPSHNRIDSSESAHSTYPTSTHHPYTFLARASEPFHFYPVLNPPPPLIATTSRSASSLRPVYLIQPEPSAPELPHWLHWDARELKLWGTPNPADTHYSYAVKVVERTVIPPGSPTKGRPSTGITIEEKVVSRLVIVVAAHLIPQPR